jgi:hypothetical protein
MIGIAVMATGLAVILGFTSLRDGIGFIKTLLVFTILAPFIDAIIMMLPLWLVLGILSISWLFLIRSMLTFLFGSEAAGHIIGAMVIGSVVFLFKAMWLPLRITAKSIVYLARRHYR